MLSFDALCTVSISVISSQTYYTNVSNLVTAFDFYLASISSSNDLISMPSLNTMIFVALIIVEMIVSVKGADPSAFQSKPELEAYTDDTAGGDMGAGTRMPPRKSLAIF